MKQSTGEFATGVNHPSIAGGIGDILLTRLVFDSTGINPIVYYNEQITRQYREGSVDHLIFVCKLLQYLFGLRFKLLSHPDIELVYYHRDYQFSEHHTNLRDWFDDYKITDEPYIVFHTKVRIDATMDAFNTATRGELVKYFQNKKFGKKVIIMGERIVERNVEQMVHEQSNIYNELKELEKNNDVMDLTVDKCYNTPLFSTFLRDMGILKRADHIFGCGWGGYFAMSWAANDNYSFYLPPQLNHPVLDFISSLGSERVCRSIDTFIKQMDKQ